MAALAHAGNNMVVGLACLAMLRRCPEALDGVTEREREVLVLVAHGLSNVEIAERLTLSLATVKTHVSRLLSKVPARDRAQLVIVAYETGLVAAPPR